MRSVAVHVVCRKASIIVGKASFSQSCAYTSYYKIHLLCLPFRLKFLLRVQRAYRSFLLLLSKVTQRHFRHSASKVHCALPRAQHGICSSIPCWCSLRLSRTQRIARAPTRFLCGQYPHSLGYFPMQRALNFSLLPLPQPPFSRRRLCICGGSYYVPEW